MYYADDKKLLWIISMIFKFIRPLKAIIYLLKNILESQQRFYLL